MLKLINRYYKILELKSLSKYKKQARIPLKLTIEKIWCRRKRKSTDHFKQISVHADMKSMKRGIFQQKTPKRNQVVKSVLESKLQTLPWHCITRNLQPDTWNKKYSKHKNRGNYIYQNNEVKEKL